MYRGTGGGKVGRGEGVDMVVLRSRPRAPSPVSTRRAQKAGVTWSSSTGPAAGASNARVVSLRVLPSKEGAEALPLVGVASPWRRL